MVFVSRVEMMRAHNSRVSVNRAVRRAGATHASFNRFRQAFPATERGWCVTRGRITTRCYSNKLDPSATSPGPSGINPRCAAVRRWDERSRANHQAL